MDTTPHKPGYKTTEFWLSLLAVLLGALLGSGLLPGGPPTQIAGMVATLLGAMGYSYQRSQLKLAVLAGIVPPDAPTAADPAIAAGAAERVAEAKASKNLGMPPLVVLLLGASLLAPSIARAQHVAITPGVVLAPSPPTSVAPADSVAVKATATATTASPEPAPVAATATASEAPPVNQIIAGATSTDATATATLCIACVNSIEAWWKSNRGTWTIVGTALGAALGVGLQFGIPAAEAQGWIK